MKLQKFEYAVAGHDGVLTDESESLVIKPCTPAELAFYEQTIALHPDFAAIIPEFCGTLQLGQSEQFTRSIGSGADNSILANASNSTALKGKPINTDVALVLGNLRHGFVKPNILDVKLGKRLWDDDAPQAKRLRFDKVAEATTTGTLGFRVAGMCIYGGKDYHIYDKLYGRALDSETVGSAFDVFFDHAGDDRDEEALADVYPGALEAVEQIERVISAQESRMFSASLLFVYEGDRAARRAAIQAMKMQQDVDVTDLSDEAKKVEGDGDDEGDESVESEEEHKLFDVKVIDFAHAQWTPGAGPDENMLCGIRNVLDVMRKMH